MTKSIPHSPSQALAIEKVVREEWGRILASLVKSLGNLQLAEDCLQDAFVSAMQHWQRNGLPRSPAGWLITAARRKAIDRLRRDQNFQSKQSELSYLADLANQSLYDHDGPDLEMATIPDKRLELIFTCCHPALDQRSQIALTLRTLCGLTTEEIARALLVQSTTMGQRLLRAKKKIAAAQIPYQIPEADQLPSRLSSVLAVIYLMFNEGYRASSGAELVRVDLSNEAIRLARVVASLLPNQPEVDGLLALMLLHDSRRIARTDGEGHAITLENQDRSKWQRDMIDEGTALLKNVLPLGQVGPYQVQAAISAVHAEAASFADTDWVQIEALYRFLSAITPTPVVMVNMAVAISYSRDPKTALAFMEKEGKAHDLSTYQHYWAAKADFLSRIGEHAEAHTAYEKALDLSENERDRTWLRNQLQDLEDRMRETAD